MTSLLMNEWMDGTIALFGLFYPLFFNQTQVVKSKIKRTSAMKLLTTIAIGIFLLFPAHLHAQTYGEWRPLFNGETLDGWIVPENDGGHWRVADGVIDYDAQSEAEGDKNLWTDKAFEDFELRVEWRLKETPYVNPNVMLIRPDGLPQRNADGEIVRLSMPDSDSGIYVRGTSKAQINIWSWPVGSGEVWGYRTDPAMSDDVKAAVTPARFADHHIGEWNRFTITMKGDRLSVELNGHLIIDRALLPGVPASGPIALQHHGSRDDDGHCVSPPSLVQFRNIEIREL